MRARVAALGLALALASPARAEEPHEPQTAWHVSASVGFPEILALGAARESGPLVVGVDAGGFVAPLVFVGTLGLHIGAKVAASGPFSLEAGVSAALLYAFVGDYEGGASDEGVAGGIGPRLTVRVLFRSGAFAAVEAGLLRGDWDLFCDGRECPWAPLVTLRFGARF